MVLESGSSSRELVAREKFDSCIDRLIGRKLLRFEARGVGPAGGGASEVVGGGFVLERTGCKPFKASVDGIRLSESEGKADKTSDDALFSRFLGTVKFIVGESSIEVEGISTLIEGGPWLVCGRAIDWEDGLGDGNCGRSCLAGASGLILPIDIFFKNPHRLDLSFSSFLRRRSGSSPGEEGGRGLMRDLRWGGVGGLEVAEKVEEKVEEVEEEGPADCASSGTVSQPVLLSGGRSLFAEIRVGLPVTPKLAKRLGGTCVSSGGDWDSVCWEAITKRFELDREVA